MCSTSDQGALPFAVYTLIRSCESFEGHHRRTREIGLRDVMKMYTFLPIHREMSSFSSNYWKLLFAAQTSTSMSAFVRPQKRRLCNTLAHGRYHTVSRAGSITSVDAGLVNEIGCNAPRSSTIIAALPASDQKGGSDQGLSRSRTKCTCVNCRDQQAPLCQLQYQRASL